MNWEEKAAFIYLGATLCAIAGGAVIWGAIMNLDATIAGMKIAGAFVAFLVGLIGGCYAWSWGFDKFLDRAERKNAEKAEKSK